MVNQARDREAIRSSSSLDHLAIGRILEGCADSSAGQLRALAALAGLEFSFQDP